MWVCFGWPLVTLSSTVLHPLPPKYNQLTKQLRALPSPSIHKFCPLPWFLFCHSNHWSPAPLENEPAAILCTSPSLLPPSPPPRFLLPFSILPCQARGPSALPFPFSHRHLPAASLKSQTGKFHTPSAAAFPCLGPCSGGGEEVWMLLRRWGRGLSWKCSVYSILFVSKVL